MEKKFGSYSKRSSLEDQDHFIWFVLLEKMYQSKFQNESFEGSKDTKFKVYIFKFFFFLEKKILEYLHAS